MNSTQMINSTQLPITYCSDIPLSNHLFLFFLSDYILLIPLFAYVSIVAYQARSSKPVSHSDIVTFNNVLFEIINVFSLLVYCCGTFVKNITLTVLGITIFSIVGCGQTVLHVLMCIERYIAVVHPMLYMKLKQTQTGKWVRNVCIVFVWLSFFAALGLVYITKTEHVIFPSYVILTVALIVVLFCSFTVLRTLVRQSPGKKTQKQRIDPAKRKALKTILFILGALLLRIIGIPVRGQLFNAATFKSCLLASVAILVNIPSSLVLPLLYLQRMGKLPGAKEKN